jgi:hypothetical protein
MLHTITAEQLELSLKTPGCGQPWQTAMKRWISLKRQLNVLNGLRELKIRKP